MIALADVGVSVTNAKASAQWWKDKVGFEVFTLGGSGHAILVAPPGDRFILHLCEGFERVEPGNTGIAFMTTDIAGMVGRMLAKGVAFPEPLKKQEWGGSAKFADPDGNVFWLLEAPEKMIRDTLRNVAGKAVPRAKKAAKRPVKKAARKAPAKRAATRGKAGRGRTPKR
jgi:catechol 2,3-dioxygenase-like lactoylglutathione lyase family enzyme